MSKLAGWLFGIIVAVVAWSFVTRALRDAAFAYVPPGAQAALAAPAPPLSVTCSTPPSDVADCTVVLSRDPAMYGATVEAIRGELQQEWCTGLARRTDGARGDAVIHVLLPDRARYADMQVQANACP